MVRNCIFLGAPGVGKGTLANVVATKTGVIHISTGAIFRSEMAAKTVLGNEVSRFLLNGTYVPDDLTNTVLLNAISAPEVKTRGFILDGYPRTHAQAEFLTANNVCINLVVLLEASLDTITSRLSHRGRADDSEAVIKERLRIYREKTQPLIDYYQAQGVLVKFNVEGSIEDNSKRFFAEVWRD